MVERLVRQSTGHQAIALLKGAIRQLIPVSFANNTGPSSPSLRKVISAGVVGG